MKPADRRPPRARRRRNLAVAGALAVGAAAIIAIGASGDGDPSGIGGEDRAIGRGVPPVRDAGERDPGGDASASVRLPPRGRWFGFSGTFFAWTGSHPDLDHGLSPQRTVADAVAAGANSARIVVGWWDLFPQPGRIDPAYEAEIDAFVEALEHRGGRVLIVLGTPPPRARLDDRSTAPRTDARTLEEFSRYAAFVARRWPNAVAIETWNEPNGTFSWSPTPDPDAYLELHRAARAAIARVRPRMTVLLGGLAATLEDPRFMNAQRYLKLLYAAGMTPRDYDGLAVHPYPQQGSDDPLARGQFAKGFEDFRLGYSWRDPRALLWVSETGATTSGPTPHSEREQAEVVVALVRKLLTTPRVKGVYLHTQYDFLAAPETSPERGFGLLESRGTRQGRPKPGFCALRALASDPTRFAGCAS